MKTNPEEIRQPRLNPFAFPSETTLRFALLIVSVIGTSLYIYSILYWRYLETQGSLEPIYDQARTCLSQKPPAPLVLKLTELTTAEDAFIQCSQSLEQEFRNAAWLAIGGVGVLMSLASLLYSLFPVLMIWKEGLISLDKQADMKDIVVYLQHLCQTMGIRPPIFLQKPTSRAIGGRAFGALGRYYVVLPTGLLTLFDQNRDTFRAVMLHELAHLRNKDVDKTYFSVAVSCAFVIVALIPFAFNLLMNSSAEHFQASWRIIALVLLVYLTLAAVVRSREFYADVRASTHPGSQALSPLLETALKPKFSGWHSTVISTLERLPYFKRNHWQFAFLFHPDASERRHILETTDHLFYFDFWAAFGTGIAVTVAYDSIASLIITLVRQLLGQTDAWLESLGAGFIFAPLVVGIIGIGVWRRTFVAIIRNQHSTEVGKLGIGLGLGMILGQVLSFDNVTSSQKFLELEKSGGAMQFASTAFNLLWSLLLLASLYYFFRWMATGASVWLSLATTSDSPRPFYRASLIVAGLWLTLWFGVIFLIRHANVLLDTPNSIGALFSLMLFFPLGVSYIALQPLTLIALFSLWAFPLSSRLWRERRTNLTSLPTWGFLEQPPDPIHLPTQPLIQVYPVLKTGLMGGLIYCGLLLILRLGIRILLPESVRDSDGFIVLLYTGHVGIAALMQSGIAIKVIRQIQLFNGVHGLFAAFTAGCVMTLGILVINLVFGGTINTQFIWETFSLVVNWGALLSLLGMMIIRLPKDRGNVSDSDLGFET